MTFTDEELDIVLCALRRFSQELDSQLFGKGSYIQIWASAWHASALVKDRAALLIEKIEAERDA